MTFPYLAVGIPLADNQASEQAAKGERLRIAKGTHVQGLDPYRTQRVLCRCVQPGTHRRPE